MICWTHFRVLTRFAVSLLEQNFLAREGGGHEYGFNSRLVLNVCILFYNYKWMQIRDQVS